MGGLRAAVFQGGFLAGGQLDELHAEGVAEDFLGVFEDTLKGAAVAAVEDFGADVGAADGRAGVFCGEGEADEFLHVGLVGGACCRLG